MTRVTFAADQPEYIPLPAAATADGEVVTEWELTDSERAAVAAGGRIRLWIWTFGRGLQPVMLQAVDAAGAVVEDKCGVCGCTEINACLDLAGRRCGWAVVPNAKGRGLCTHCVAKGLA